MSAIEHSLFLLKRSLESKKHEISWLNNALDNLEETKAHLEAERNTAIAEIEKLQQALKLYGDICQS